LREKKKLEGKSTNGTKEKAQVMQGNKKKYENVKDRSDKDEIEENKGGDVRVMEDYVPVLKKQTELFSTEDPEEVWSALMELAHSSKCVSF